MTRFTCALWLELAASMLKVGVCSADMLVAPDHVTAHADGSFHYSWKFYKGPGSGVVGSYGWVGVNNVDGGQIADCFCNPLFCAIQEGDSLLQQVTGQLTDPTQVGRVGNYVSFCSGGSSTNVYTLVFPTATGVDDAIASGNDRLRNEPNPFSTSTTFQYSLRDHAPVSLRIYDLSGRCVATVVDEIQSAGNHSATWDTRNARTKVVGGVHFARLIVQGQVRSRRIVVTQ